MRLPTLCSLFALLTVGIAHQPASAASDLTPLLGRWAGLATSMMSAGDQPAAIAFASTRNRRLHGTLEIDPCIFPIDVTISAAGQISGGGSDSDGDSVRIQGQLRAFGDGSVRSFGDGSVRFADGSVRIAALRYIAVFADGSVRKGYVGLAQMLGGADWDRAGGSDVTGKWTGNFMMGDGSVRGALELDLANVLSGRDGKTSALRGGATFSGITDGTSNTFFDLQGSIGLPAVQDGTSNFVLIGLNQPTGGGTEKGIIAILIGLLLPAVQDNPVALQGNFLLFNSLQDLFHAASKGGGGGFTGGDFYLPAVQ